MKRVAVHVRCNAAGKIRHEKLNGRDVIIVPSFTLKSGIVMNGIKYEHDEIEKSYKGLERTPAPLGHPTIGGKFVSASDPEGINVGYIGAFNVNVRREGERIAIDKVIDVEVANRSEGGKRVLKAIEAGTPIHTSTGLLCNLEPVANAEDHKFLAKNIVWNHDAILLDEAGAATPDDGTGIFVNSSSSEDDQEIEVINSAVEQADQDIDWAMDSLARAIDRRQRASSLDKLKSLIIEAYDRLTGTERETTLNKKEDDMAVSDEQFTALSQKVDALSEALKPDALATSIGNMVKEAIKPLTDSHAEIVANQKAKDEEELKGLREKIVKSNLMDEASAGELTLNAAKALAKSVEPGKATALNGAFKPAGDKVGFQLPEGE